MKKNHHYLPQFYVKGFTNINGKVSVYHRKDDKIKSQGKKGTFHIPYFYSVDFSKYKKNIPELAQKIKKAYGVDKIDSSEVKEHPDIVEDLLSESENYAAVIIQKLIAGKNISDEDRIELSTFIAFMYTRTPAFRLMITGLEKKETDDKINQIFSSNDSSKEIYQKMRNNGYKEDVDLDEIAEVVKEKRYNIKIPKEMNIKTILFSTMIIDKILYNKTWLILRTSKSSFITSDIPVFLSHPNIYQPSAYGVGFETSGVKVIFPLSKELLLIMQNTQHGKQTSEINIDKMKTRKINQLTAGRSGDYIIARDFALIEKVIKYL